MFKPRVGAEPAGWTPRVPAAALEVNELQGQVHHEVDLTRNAAQNQFFQLSAFLTTKEVVRFPALAV